MKENSKILRTVRLAIPMMRALVAAAVLTSLAPQPASGQVIGQCMEPVSGIPGPCTANDISLSLIVLEGSLDGCTGPTDTATVVFRAQINPTAKDRYDIGMWIGLDGDAVSDGVPANQCLQDFLGPSLFDNLTSPFCETASNPGGGGDSPLSGSGPYCDVESAVTPTDTCGDTQQDVLYEKVLQQITMICADNDGNGLFDVSSCVSWDNNSNTQCKADFGTMGVPQSDGPVPGTGAKCNCSFQETTPALAVPDLSVTKTCTSKAFPGGIAECTVTYENASSQAAGDYISLIDDYDQTQGSVGSLSASGGSDCVADEGSSGIEWIPDAFDAVPGNGCTVDGSTDPSSPGEDFANVPASGSGTLTYLYTVDPGVASGTIIENQVCLHWNNVNQGDFGTPVAPFCDEAEIEVVAATAAWVSGFGAYADGGNVVVEWETATEVGTLGFDLLRLDERTGALVQVNRELLPGLLHSPQGGVYRFVDEGVGTRGTARYVLREIEVSGGERLYGPFSAAVDWDRLDPSPARGFSSTPHAPPADFARRLIRAERELSAAVAERGMRGGLATSRDGGGGRFANLAVRETGLYSATAAEIATALGRPRRAIERWIRGGKLRLTHRGREVAYEPMEGSAGITFFGEAIDSNFTLENVYVLGPGRGPRMRRVSGRAPRSGGDGSYTAQLALEQDRLPVSVIPMDPREDHWFWDFIIESHASHGRKEFAASVPNAIDGAAGRVTVRLRGLSSTLHRARVEVNGHDVGTTSFGNQDAKESSFEVPSGVLVAGVNTIGVVGTGPGSSTYYIDGFELEHEARFVAADERLLFAVDSPAPVTVSGFANREIAVYEITRPRGPRRVTRVTIAGDAGDYRVSFVPGSAGSRYLAVSGLGRSVPALAGRRSAGLASRDRRVDYVVIVPEALRAGAEDLADYREATGLRPRIVELQEVYDVFNGGIADPQAIRDFVAFAATEWAGEPSYFTLAGAGSLDYRLLISAGGNLIPPMLVVTESGIVASDLAYGDVHEDGRPVVTVSRIPVLSSAELSAYVDKLAAAEAGGPWSHEVLQVADDGAGFARDSDDLGARFPSGYGRTPLYLASSAAADVTALRTQLFAGLNAGAGHLSYTGHGAIQQLADEGLLKVGDIGAAGDLENTDMQPLFTSWTCNVNRFEIPWAVGSLGAALVSHKGAGAVAVLAPSGLAVSADSRELGEAFYQALFAGSGRVGDALVEAFETVWSPDTANSLKSYNLLGDSAFRAP